VSGRAVVACGDVNRVSTWGYPLLLSSSGAPKRALSGGRRTSARAISLPTAALERRKAVDSQPPRRLSILAGLLARFMGRTRRAQWHQRIRSFFQPLPPADVVHEPVSYKSMPRSAGTSRTTAEGWEGAFTPRRLAREKEAYLAARFAATKLPGIGHWVEVVVIGRRRPLFPLTLRSARSGSSIRGATLRVSWSSSPSFHFGCLVSHAEASDFGFSTLECLRLGVPVIRPGRLRRVCVFRSGYSTGPGRATTASVMRRILRSNQSDQFSM
jgi:hypothetical protein